jgi:adenylate kinase
LKVGRVIAVFGVSGVGKTAVIQRFTQDYPSFQHVSASSLLRDATAASVEAPRDSSEDRIRANQKLLTTRFAALRSKHTERHIIFDGHSVIDGEADLTVIPTDVIAALDPVCLVFIQDDPAQIVERRRADTRPRPERGEGDLAAYQEAALTACRAYATDLQVPLHQIASGDLETFAQVVLMEADRHGAS